MANIGEKLRLIRLRRELSLRVVKELSEQLGKDWGSDSYRISGSWLARLERGTHEMTVPKLVTLSTIYGVPAEELLREFQPKPMRQVTGKRKKLPVPNGNQLVMGGFPGLEVQRLLTDGFNSSAIPEHTMLLPPEEGYTSSPYRRVIVGRRDRTLAPMIRPGSIFKIDIRRKSIPLSKSHANDFNRPIYLVLTRNGYVCGWCELDEQGTLTIAPHSLSGESYQHWKHKKEVEVIGQAVAVVLHLTD